jgi:ATP-dependent Lon protease
MKDRKENKDNEKLADRDPEVKDKSGVDEGRKARSGNRPGGTAKISQVKKMSSLPLIPLRGVIIFPGVALSLDIGRSASVAALREAMKSGQELIIAMQKDMSKDEPKPDDIYRIAVRGRVRQLLELPDNMFKILVEGMERVRIVRYNKLDPYFKVATVQYTDLPDAAENDNWKQAAARSLIKRFRSYAEHSGKIAPEPQAVLEGSSDPDLIVNHLCHLLPLSGPEQQNLLESTSLSQRVELMLNYIQRESELSKIERQLDEKVKTKINRSQREYFLREQIRTIQSELGGDDETEMLDDRNEMLKKLEQSKMQDDYKEKIRKEIDRFSRIPPSFPEATVQRNWIELLLELPFGRVDEEHLDLKAARKILDRDHYGMKKLKERIMEYLAVRKLQLDRQDQAEIRSPILCFVGPPGTGKTSIAKAIAETLGRRYVSMSLGGIKDEAEIRGHRRTYIGAMPGRVIQGIRQAGTDNPLFLLDEIDKLGTDFRGDPSSALLEVLDPEQNDKFRDHYVEFPYDLSQVLFITTANNGDRIPDPLYDRMEVIEVSGYTEEEKIEIACPGSWSSTA